MFPGISLHRPIAAGRRCAAVRTAIVIDLVAVIANLTLGDHAVAADRTRTVAAASVRLIVIAIVTGFIPLFARASIAPGDAITANSSAAIG